MEINHSTDEYAFRITGNTTETSRDALRGSGRSWETQLSENEYMYFTITIDEPLLDITIIDYSFTITGAHAVLVKIDNTYATDWVIVYFRTL